MSAVLAHLERLGPEPSGPPLRAVAVLARDVGPLLAPASDALALRRRQATAARVARSALSFATALHAAFGDRPEPARAWARAMRQLRERHARLDDGDPSGCARRLSRVAALVLLLPRLHDDEGWEAETIAFADEGTLAELHGACVDLAAAAARVGADAGGG